MIRCPDNQINASFIDISRIKWLVVFLWSSFFRTTSTLASSEAPADYQPAPGRTDGVPERHSKTMDYKSVFTNLCLELQQNRSWIKGLCKIHKRVNSFTDGSAFCPGAPKRVPLARNTCVYTRHPTFVTATSGVVDTASGKTLQKTECSVYTYTTVRQAVGKKNCRVYTASEAKGLITKTTSIFLWHPYELFFISIQNSRTFWSRMPPIFHDNFTIVFLV